MLLRVIGLFRHFARNEIDEEFFDTFLSKFDEAFIAARFFCLVFELWVVLVKDSPAY